MVENSPAKGRAEVLSLAATSSLIYVMQNMMLINEWNYNARSMGRKLKGLSVDEATLNSERWA
jgi:hypothetical protein